jgi:hypothetical protein
MKQESITYLVEYFCNNNFVKSNYVTNEVNFTRKGTMMKSNLTSAEIFNNIKNNVPDLEQEQYEPEFGMFSMNGLDYIGVPTKVKINLSVFQMRRGKLATIGDMFAEAE